MLTVEHSHSHPTRIFKRSAFDLIWKIRSARLTLARLKPYDVHLQAAQERELFLSWTRKSWKTRGEFSH